MVNKIEKLKEIYEKISTPDEKIIDLLEKIDREKLKGEDGKTPEKGVDYFTDEEISDFLKKVTPKKGKHYHDGKTPTREQLIELIIPLIPEPKNGKDGIEISAEQIRDKLKTLEGEGKLSIFDLKDIEWLKNSKGMNWSSAGFKVYTDNTLSGDGSSSNPLHVEVKGASSVGTNTLQISDGNGGFNEIAQAVWHNDTETLDFGISTIDLGVLNATTQININGYGTGGQIGLLGIKSNDIDPAIDVYANDGLTRVFGVSTASTEVFNYAYLYEGMETPTGVFWNGSNAYKTRLTQFADGTAVFSSNVIDTGIQDTDTAPGWVMAMNGSYNWFMLQTMPPYSYWYSPPTPFGVNGDTYHVIAQGNNTAFPPSDDMASTFQVYKGPSDNLAASFFGDTNVNGKLGVGLFGNLPVSGIHLFYNAGGTDPTGKLTLQSTSGSYGQFQIVNPGIGEASVVLAADATLNTDGTISSTDSSYIWAFGPGSFGAGLNKFGIASPGFGNHIITADGSTGYVGIANTSPAYRLDVAGDINLTGTLRNNGGTWGYEVPSGTVDGTNKLFSFSVSPSVIVVDGVVMNRVQSDGTINWTDSSGTITLSVAPNNNIFKIQ